MNFQIKSTFKPTGDQPQAIKGLTSSVNQGNPHQTLLGVTGSGKTFTLANVIQNTNLPTLIISHNKTLAAQLYQEFRDFFPNNAVSYFVSYYDYYQPEAYLPATDTYIEKETEINDEIDKLRLSTTANLLTRSDVIVVASVSCIYNLGSPVEYGKNFVEIIEGQLIERSTLIKRLTDIQYSRSDFELKRGTFRVSGEVITVWPADLSYALKLTFLEDIIQNIKAINPLSGEAHIDVSLSSFTNSSHRYLIYPAKHYQAGNLDKANSVNMIKHDLLTQLQYLKAHGKTLEAYRLSQKVKYDLEMIQELGYVNGIENYSRYFDGRQPGDPPYTLLDYFAYNQTLFKKESFLTIIDESHITLPQIRGMYFGDQSRKQVLIDYGFRLPSALDNRPLKSVEVQERLPQIIYASATPSDAELTLSKNNLFEQLIRPTGLIEPEIFVRPIQNQIQDCIHEILLRLPLKERILITTLTKRTAEALTEYLNNPSKISKVAAQYSLKIKRFPKVQYLHADVATLDRQDILDSLRSGEYDVIIGINLLREGLDLPEVSLVAIFEADKEGFLRSKTSLIQTMGRASRHHHGQVILYADNITKSMQSAIDEIDRRKQYQLAYNQKHQITPLTINKPIRDKLILRVNNPDKSNSFSESSIDYSALTPQDRELLIKKYQKLMNQAAKNWEFETAAKIRDEISMLKSKS